MRLLPGLVILGLFFVPSAEARRSCSSRVADALVVSNTTCQTGKDVLSASGKSSCVAHIGGRCNIEAAGHRWACATRSIRRAGIRYAIGQRTTCISGDRTVRFDFYGDD